MTTPFIPVNKPKITDEDINSVVACLKDGWISGDGPIVENFELAVRSQCGRKHSAAVANGTVAIDLAFEALKIEPGDQVIVPSFTIISCISYLLRVGAVPIFVDSKSDTWNLDVDQLESKITSKTKAILVPHIYGLPAEMDRILEIAVKHRIPVVEDAAESHGLTFRGRPCGSFGDISTFSFYANKNVTTGEGGMVLTDDEKLILEIKNLRNLNFRHDDRFVSDELGYNYRISSMQAALGASQISRLSEIINRRQAIASYYTNELKDIGDIQLPLVETEYAKNIYWVFGLKLSGKLQGKSKYFQHIFNQNGIGTRPFFQPLHKQPVLEKFNLSDQAALPVSEDLGSSGFYIPNGLGMTDLEVETVADVTKRIFSESRK